MECFRLNDGRARARSIAITSRKCLECLWSWCESMEILLIGCVLLQDIESQLYAVTVILAGNFTVSVIS